MKCRSVWIPFTMQPMAKQYYQQRQELLDVVLMLPRFAAGSSIGRSGGTVISEVFAEHPCAAIAQAPSLRILQPTSRSHRAFSRGGQQSPKFQGDVQSPVDRFHHATANDVTPIPPVNLSVGIQESTMSPMVISNPKDKEQTGTNSTEIRLESRPTVLVNTRYTSSKPANSLGSDQPVLRIRKGIEGKVDNSNDAYRVRSLRGRILAQMNVLETLHHGKKRSHEHPNYQFTL
jgi:hypothetical protein